MVRSPYKAPEANSDPNDLPGVTVVSRWPMDIRAERVFAIDLEGERLNERIARAAKACDLSGKKAIRDGFQFHRGSNWQSLYTFDIRRIPTVVTVSLATLHRVYVAFQVGSVWQLSTPSDARGIFDDVNRFQEACLRDD